MRQKYKKEPIQFIQFGAAYATKASEVDLVI